MVTHNSTPRNSVASTSLSTLVTMAPTRRLALSANHAVMVHDTATPSDMISPR